jgi:hypothetical protein
MAADSEYEPPSRDDDAVTYLPIDKIEASRVGFGPTDLRAAKATGGIRLGQNFIFVLDEAMPPLQADHIATACDNVIRGQEVYASLVYLSRAQPSDVPAVMEASSSYEIKVRWERLWVLCGTLARLARRPEGQEALVASFKDDLAGLHLVSKFAEQNNPAIKRLFARLKPTLLPMLLGKLAEHLNDPRRGALLCGIIAHLETQEEVLRAAMPKELPPSTIDALMQMLYTVAVGQSRRTLSSGVLKERLQGWRQGP